MEEGEYVTDFEFSSYPRPDVKKVFRDANIHSGFVIKIEMSKSGISLDNLRIQLTNEYNSVVINLEEYR